jgi:CheY-like chemotaxis protein
MSGAHRSSKTILVVDQDRAFREVVRDVLEEAGYHVLLAPGALEALQVNRTYRGRLHVALIDAAMPLLDGITVAEQLRKNRPVRLLFMSGQTLPIAKPTGRMCRRTAFIQKPLTSADLLRAVREALESHRRP